MLIVPRPLSPPSPSGRNGLSRGMLELVKGAQVPDHYAPLGLISLLSLAGYKHYVPPGLAGRIERGYHK